MVPLLLLASLCVASAEFAIKDETWGSGASAVRVKVLLNTATGEFAKIIVDSGGSVDSLSLFDKVSNKLRPLLVSNDGDAVAVRLNAHYRGNLLAPFANRVRNGTYHWRGNRYSMVRNEMGADRNDSLHGFLFNKTLTVVDQQTSATRAELTLLYHFDGKDPGYPFQFDMFHTYTLTASDGFKVRARAVNTMKEDPFPFTHGWCDATTCSTAQLIVSIVAGIRTSSCKTSPKRL